MKKCKECGFEIRYSTCEECARRKRRRDEADNAVMRSPNAFENYAGSPMIDTTLIVDASSSSSSHWSGGGGDFSGGGASDNW